MLVLYETALGYCLFKLTNDAKLNSSDLYKEFETPEQANSLLKLRAIHRFTSTATAVEDYTSIQEGKLPKGLKQFLSDEIVNKGKGKETLAIVEPKLANAISKKLGINVVADSATLELYRGIRGQLTALLDGLNPEDLATMSLGLSHSLSRFKLKFSPDKVDTMVIQAIALLDDLDKEINIYSMRVKEWYGWHFPEMGKIITDNLAYAKVVRLMGFRTNAATTDFAAILPEDLEATLKVAAEISMGTEISEPDINHIFSLCEQVISITEYRSQLAEYLRNRMSAIAPNLTVLVGELVGARLISHAGSLLNLAKHPASTVQILGAEKALFRALKTKHDTPKYGLIYHASLIGQAPPKLKGKMARMVATKAALSIRVDALTDAEGKSEPSAPTIGVENRAKLESRLRALEYQNDMGGIRHFADPSSSKKQKKFEMNTDVKTYNTAADAVDLLPTQRDSSADMSPVERAVKVAMDVREEKKHAKEEKKKQKEKAKKEEDDEGMEVDSTSKSVNGKDEESPDAKAERKRLKKEAKKAEKEKKKEEVKEEKKEEKEEVKEKKKDKKKDKEVKANGSSPEKSEKKKRKREEEETHVVEDQSKEKKKKKHKS